MSYQSAAGLLDQSLRSLYMNRIILDYTGHPFRVQRLVVLDDSPDPGWVVWFHSHYPTDPRDTKQARTVGLGEPLPEVWPDSMWPDGPSPCS